MKLEVNFEKKYFIASVLIVALIVGGVYVYAQTAVPNPGHNIAQIGGLPNCAEGQFLTQNNGVWSCGSPASGGGSGTMVKYGTFGPFTFGETIPVDVGFQPDMVIIVQDDKFHVAGHIVDQTKTLSFYNSDGTPNAIFQVSLNSNGFQIVTSRGGSEFQYIAIKN